MVEVGDVLQIGTARTSAELETGGLYQLDIDGDGRQDILIRTTNINPSEKTSTIELRKLLESDTEVGEIPSFLQAREGDEPSAHSFFNPFRDLFS